MRGFRGLFDLLIGLIGLSFVILLHSGYMKEKYEGKIVVLIPDGLNYLKTKSLIKDIR